jgi:hypothetical protein
VAGGADVQAFPEGKHQGVVEFNGEFASRVVQFVERCVGRPRAQGPGRPGSGQAEAGPKVRPEAEGPIGSVPEIVAPDDWRNRDITRAD